MIKKSFYDVVKKMRPDFFKAIEADANSLLAAGASQQPIMSTEFSGSNYAQLEDNELKKFYDWMEINYGLSKIDIINNWRSLQDSPNIQGWVNMTTQLTLEYCSLVNFNLFGRKLFQFEENLCEHLSHTEANMISDFIRLPFQSCLFTYHSKPIIDAFHGSFGTSGIMNINSDLMDYEAPLSVFVSMHDNYKNSNNRMLSIISFHGKDHDHIYGTSKRQLLLIPGSSIDSCIRTDWEEINPNDIGFGYKGSYESLEPASDEDFYQGGYAYYRCILNSILYVNSSGADLVPATSRHDEIREKAKKASTSKQKEKIMRGINKYSSVGGVIVGDNIGAIVIKNREDGEAAKSDGVNHLRLTRRFIVRGHWRDQPYGEARALIKPIFIKPYYKGPEMADIINRPYLVK
ncbi:hypothetical protein [Pseudomonas sp. S1(2024)]|uniref:hypothetical protein n=1 Tax=Pseudomonas sp. S1(2024) TaxID=3390191 RepID=UPI00397E0912